MPKGMGDNRSFTAVRSSIGTPVSVLRRSVCAAIVIICKWLKVDPGAWSLVAQALLLWGDQKVHSFVDNYPFLQAAYSNSNVDAVKDIINAHTGLSL